MTDTPAPKPILVSITLEDAETLRGEMRELNKGMSRILGHMFSAPFQDRETDKAKVFNQGVAETNALVDRLTIAIHEAKKAQS